jgi:hypothetical protein
MTLILSVVAPDYALQVSDRLVSKRGLPHDPLANKSVVFKGPDGLLALGTPGPLFWTMFRPIRGSQTCCPAEGAQRALGQCNLEDFPCARWGPAYGTARAT